MPDPYSFLDDEHQIPWAPWGVRRKRERNCSDYFLTYDNMHAEYLSRGITFFDFTGTSLGSEAELIANGDFSGPWLGIGENQWTNWCDRDQGLPYSFPTGYMGQELHGYTYSGAPEDYWTDSQWEVFLVTLLLLGSHKDKFYVGWMQRCYCRYDQIKIAQTLLNCFCLDNRGRPSLV